MSPHSPATPPAVAGVSPTAGPSLDATDPSPAAESAGTARVALWPAADRESPAGPVQVMPCRPVSGEVTRARVAPAQVMPIPTQSTSSAAGPVSFPRPAPGREQSPTPAAATPDRPPLADSLGAVAFMLFELQRPGPLAELRTLGEARSEPGHAREEEHRGSRTHADAFALLGEIGFLDF